MHKDRERWNEKYAKQPPMPSGVSKILSRYLSLANTGRALDIACGTGRNTHYLAENGFSVDAVDISDYALAKIEDTPAIHKINADLDEYAIEPETYDLILNCNYLERRLFEPIVKGLKKDGLLIFETFIKTQGKGYRMPSNDNFLLEPNELLHVFKELHIIYYEEHEEENPQGEKVKVASLVARKGVKREV